MAPAPAVPTPPAHSGDIKVDFAGEHVLLLTLNRPKALNAMSPTMLEDMRRVLDWFEQEPGLWAVIITGAGRVFCAGADLIAWNKDQQAGTSNEEQDILSNPHGFGSVSRRASKKPIIAAVRGGAYGGGVEMILNCDLVVAADNAKFALPEVKRGVVAFQGGIARLARIAGHQLASEMLLLGKTVSANEARDRFGFVNLVVPESQDLEAAIGLAQQIVENSPDAVQSTKKALLLSHNYGVDEMVAKHIVTKESRAVYAGENIKEGLKAFSERRAPRWKNPARL